MPSVMMTYGCFQSFDCLLNHAVGCIPGVVEDDLLFIGGGGSEGKGHEESNEDEMECELHVDGLRERLLMFLE
jgi:hypothetical protein